MGTNKETIKKNEAMKQDTRNMTILYPKTSKEGSKVVMKNDKTVTSTSC